MNERESLIKKLLQNLHVTVAERQVLGALHEREVAETIKAILEEQGAFPRPRSGKIVFEGAVITANKGQLDITWARAYPLNPTIVAKHRRETFTDLDAAIRAYIDSEWPRGIDGIPIHRQQ